MTPIERRIASQFDSIADRDWFPNDIESSSPQLKIMREILQPVAGMKILDAGCARGRILKSLAPDGYGVDLTEQFISDARTNVPTARFTCGSISSLPYADKIFDAVICNEALEHVPDTTQAIHEFARVLKPNGILIVIDKSWTGIHPRTLLPNLIWKPWHEAKGRWMYPADFPFREKWFWPRAFSKLLQTRFAETEVRFLAQPGSRSAPLVGLVPWLAFEAAWIARRPFAIS